MDTLVLDRISSESNKKACNRTYAAQSPVTESVLPILVRLEDVHTVGEGSVDEHELKLPE